MEPFILSLSTLLPLLLIYLLLPSSYYHENIDYVVDNIGKY